MPLTCLRVSIWTQYFSSKIKFKRIFKLYDLSVLMYNYVLFKFKTNMKRIIQYVNTFLDDQGVYTFYNITPQYVLSMNEAMNLSLIHI